jgi:hypothetical protein
VYNTSSHSLCEQTNCDATACPWGSNTRSSASLCHRAASPPGARARHLTARLALSKASVLFSCNQSQHAAHGFWRAPPARCEPAKVSAFGSICGRYGLAVAPGLRWRWGARPRDDRADPVLLLLLRLLAARACARACGSGQLFDVFQRCRAGVRSNGFWMQHSIFE